MTSDVLPFVLTMRPAMMDLDTPRPDLWHVAFPSDAALSHPAWWSRFLAEGYRHVFAFRALDAERTLLVNHHGLRLEVEALPVPASIVALRVMAAGGGQVLSVCAEAPARPMLRGPMTCTEAVKALLGVRGWRIVTPRQLYRHLLARGAACAPLPNPPPPSQKSAAP